MKSSSHNLPLSLFILLALFLAASGYSQNPSKARKQAPNIILFMVDDMGWQDTSVPFYYEKGKPVETFLNKRYKTPNMEKLAAQGMKFTNAYAQPICSPSRISLMSGMNSARHRVTNWTLGRDQSTDAGNKNVLPPPDWNVNGLQPVGTRPSGKTNKPILEEEIAYKMGKPYATADTLPGILKKGGYITIHCGKAHFGSRETPGANPLNMGFDYNIAGTEIGGPADYRGSQKYGTGPFHVRGLDENNYYRDDVFLTEALTREALTRLDAIQENPEESGKPFYLYMSHYAIHAPFDHRGYDKRFAENYKNPEDGKPWSDNEKRYSALIEGMDKGLGDIMSYLKENNLDKNTIIMFMSDNGGLAISGRLGNELANYPLSAGKGSGREGGIREPMIVSWPGVTKPGSVCDMPVIIEDFFPTIVQMAGMRVPRTEQVLDGVSFAPCLNGAGKPSRDRPLLFHVPNIWGEGSGNTSLYGPFTAVRLGDWKLIYWHVGQRLELFNLANDIGEKNNVLKEEPAKAKALAEVMTKLLKERKAQMPTYKKENSLGIPEGKTVPWPNTVIAAKLK